MFTGIVEEVGSVRETRPGVLTIAARKVMEGLATGGSINVNGACLTVISHTPGGFSVDLVPETLRRTNLGGLKVGDGVDLERPLAAAGRLDGHIVQGHVDGTAAVSSIAEEGDAMLMTFRAAPSVMRYVVEKGFIAVDGTSLTVVHCDRDEFVITIIPFTRENTVLGSRAVGDIVNVEVDILAKYVERLSSGARGEAAGR